MALPGAQAPSQAPSPSAPAQGPGKQGQGMAKQAGMMARARVTLLAARKACQMALAMIDDMASEEGKAALDALKALAKISGDTQPGLAESEGKSLQQAVQPQAGGGGGTQMAGPQPSYPMGRSEQGFMGTGNGA